MAGDPVWKRRILETPRVDRVAGLGEYGVTLKILGTVRAAEQWAAAGEFRKRLLAAFRANGIEIPRPQRVVLARSDGTGGSGRRRGCRRPRATDWPLGGSTRRSAGKRSQATAGQARHRPCRER